MDVRPVARIQLPVSLPSAMSTIEIYDHASTENARQFLISA